MYIDYRTVEAMSARRTHLMIRRLTALAGILVLLSILIALIWAVHLHRRHTLDLDEDTATVLHAERVLTNPSQGGAADDNP